MDCFYYTLPESLVVQNQAFTIDDNFSNESLRAAPIPEASLRATFVAQWVRGHRPGVGFLDQYHCIAAKVAPTIDSVLSVL